LAIPLAKKRPTLETERLVLRPFERGDAPRVQQLAGDRAIAATTLKVPDPYEDGLAEKWIATHTKRFEKGQEIVFAFALQRIHAYHFRHNPASGRVLQKIGMQHEGRLRQHVKKWGQFVDNELYSILRSEFDAAP